jgi:catechol 2,3-dioxygenase-like lactoylglutathione lyase family enzyme
METRIAVLALWADDLPAAARFCRDALGLPLQPHHPGQRLHFDVNGITLTLLPGKPPCYLSSVHK